MENYTYQPKGVCATEIQFGIEDGKLHNVRFTRGCNGNLQGITQLVRGQKIDDVIGRLDGIRCGTKGTSCPDQLCRALEQLKNAPVV